MRMRILDRYTLRAFFTPWSYCLATFLFLFVIIDLFNRLDDFVEAGVPFLDVSYYYIRFLTTAWVMVAPITMLLGLLYALYTLTRNNEVIAMRASGVSLYRILLPFFVLGVAISMFTWWVNEYIAPGNEAWTRGYIEQIKRNSGEAGQDLLVKQRYRNPEGKRTWNIGLMDKVTFEMKDVTLTQLQPGDNNRTQFELQAERATWTDGHWSFYEVTIYPHNEEGQALPKSMVEHYPARMMLHVTEPPEKILRETKKFDWMSSREMKTYLEERISVSDKTRYDLETRIHLRNAQPWMCLIVTLLAVPFGTQTARKGMFTGVLLCLGLFFSFFFVITLAKALGQSGHLPPFWAGWAPILLFTSIGALTVHRLR